MYYFSRKNKSTSTTPSSTSIANSSSSKDTIIFDTDGDVEFDKDDDHYNQHNDDHNDQQHFNHNSDDTAQSSSSSNVYEISPSFDMPYAVRNAIGQIHESYFEDPTFKLSGKIYQQGICYVILPKEIYIWSIDKPTIYDRIDLPQQVITMNENQVMITRNKNNYDTFTALYCTNEGHVRYLPQTNRPNHYIEISLDFRSSSNVYIAECFPYGIIVGNSLGSIYLITISSSGDRPSLSSKMINKTPGFFSSYLYLARQSPVVWVSSTSGKSGTSRYSYVLTESSLIKYEIMESGEKTLIDYSLSRDLSSIFYGLSNYRFNQMFVSESEDSDIIYILIQQSIPQQQIKKYYLMSLTVKQNNTVANVCKIDQFSFIYPMNEISSNFNPTLAVIDKKFYLCSLDYIYYMSMYKEKICGEMKSTDLIICSGIWKNRFYFMDRQNRVQILNIMPYSVSNDQFELKHTDQQITFDIPEEEDDIGRKRNILLKTLNAYVYRTKRPGILEQSIDVCKKMNPMEFDNAVRRTSIYIADQKPLVRYWASDNDALKNLGTGMSVQLKQQLEDKKKRHSTTISFLKEYGFWSNSLSVETRELIDENDRRINSAIELRDYQNLQQQQQQQQLQIGAPTHYLLSKLIHLVVEDRMGPNWVSCGMTVYELFYSMVTQIDDLLVRTLHEMRDVEKQGDSLLKLKQTLEGNTIFLKITGKYSREMLCRHIRAGNKDTSIHLMTKQMIDHTTEFIQSDLTAGAPSYLRSQADSGLSASESVLYTQLYELTRSFLSVLNEQDIRSCSTALLSPFVFAARYHHALNLAKEFEDYRTVVEVYIGDSDHRTEQLANLEKELVQYLKNGRIKDVFRYMLDRGLSLEILKLPNEPFGKAREDFFKEYPRLEWINDIAQNRYNDACRILTLESAKENKSISRKKTLISLAKLSALAEQKEPMFNLTQVVDDANHNLEILKIQKEFLPHLKGVLSVDQIIHEILQLSNLQNMEKYLVCLNTLEEAKLIISLQERINLLKLLLLKSLDNGPLFILCEKLAQGTDLSDQQFDLQIINSDTYQLLCSLPSDAGMGALVNEFIKDYFKERQKSIKDSNIKQQLNRVLSRLIELYSQNQQ